VDLESRLPSKILLQYFIPDISPHAALQVSVNRDRNLEPKFITELEERIPYHCWPPYALDIEEQIFHLKFLFQIQQRLSHVSGVLLEYLNFYKPDFCSTFHRGILFRGSMLQLPSRYCAIELGKLQLDLHFLIDREHLMLHVGSLLY
jgi:hypothetical protein